VKPHIEVENLTLRYPGGDTAALDDVSFSLAPDRVYGLLGRNGSGKTSLLSLLAAFRKPTAGRVRLDGEPVYENPGATRQICLIRGHGDTVVHDWPEDRVKDALRTAGMLRPAWDQAYADELVDMFELPRKKRLNELSTGQRSQLGVALGLASRAPVTLLDESYLGMDAPSRYRFYDELLRDYVAHPRTIIVSTHLIEEVGTLFEEVLILDRGRLLLHEEVDVLRGRGAAVTGPAAEVDAFTEGLTVLSERQLGPTKQATIYGAHDPLFQAKARAHGMDLAPVPLQDLFVHLTEPDGGGRATTLRPDHRTDDRPPSVTGSDSGDGAAGGTR
jgi:ABC-2 type transport system ATP-binding protein